MARNTFSDMTPRKRSIRDIPIPGKAHDAPVRAQYTEREEVEEMKDGFFSDLGKKEAKTRKGGGRMWILIILFIIGGFWGASVFLHSATVHISPEKALYTGSITISAKTEASPTELQYDSLQFVESASRKVTATAEEDVSTKATGRIVIYNAYSTAPQKLIATTRFEAASGKIYRIQEAVSVPGYKMIDGQKVPGSIEATVHADMAGDTYNDTKTDFTIPGFKDTPQYQGFYARSITDITGGFIGKQKKIDPTVLTEATEALKSEISGKVAQSILAKIPSDFIFISGGDTIDYIVKPISSEGDQAIITVEGTIRAHVFKKDGIDDVLRSAVPGISTTRVMAHDYNKLSIAAIVVNEDNSSLQATLSGEATIYAAIDKDTIAKELAGIKKGLIGTVMNTHSEIISSAIYIRPPWMLSLPDNPERIHIIEQIDE